MKIAFIVDTFSVLSETFILNQITGLLDLGHEVDIFSYNKQNHVATMHTDVKTYDLLNRTYYPEMTAIMRKRPLKACRGFSYGG